MAPLIIYYDFRYLLLHQMNPSDFCNVIFLLFTSCFIYVNNKIFVLFVSSKPDGRKTVLGRIPRIYLIKC